MTTKPLHNFHIPVMGLAYTIDSPIRVAQYGISSVISIIDDEILEKMKTFTARSLILIIQESQQKQRITEPKELLLI